MKLISNLIILAIALFSSYCSVDTSKDVILMPPPPPSLESQVSEGQRYVQKVMTACGAKLSEAKVLILSSQIYTVAKQIFQEDSDRRWFYTLICIESRFNNEARSPVGAIGLTQVMPQYAKEFAKACGLGELDAKDLADSQVNLLVGACRFKELMLFYEGDVTLALAAYNGGMNSPTVKKVAASDIRTGHPETVGYLAAAFVLEQRMQKVKRTNETK